VVGRVSERVAGHYVYSVNVAVKQPHSHVELILEINKTVIAASSWFPYLLYLSELNLGTNK
jgi:hypothetical protein